MTTLKGEVLLANGSRIVFEAPKWTFSHPVIGDPDNSDYVFKAEERPHQSGIHIDGKQFAQKIRDMQNQSIKINVELTEEGKRAVKEAVLGKVEDKHSKPPIGSWDDWDKWVKDMYALLLVYVETFPWEHELKDRAQPLLNHVYKALSEQFEEETPKKQEESTDLFDVISKTAHNFPGACNVTAQSDKDRIMATYHVNIHTWELAVYRPQGKNIPIGETMLKTDLQKMAREHNIDLTKGWKVVNHQYKY